MKQIASVKVYVGNYWNSFGTSMKIVCIKQVLHEPECMWVYVCVLCVHVCEGACVHKTHREIS